MNFETLLSNDPWLFWIGILLIVMVLETYSSWSE